MMRLFRHLQLWLTGRGSHLQPATLWSHSLHEDSNAWKGSASRGRRCVGAIASGRTSVGGLAGEASGQHRAWVRWRACAVAGWGRLWVAPQCMGWAKPSTAWQITPGILRSLTANTRGVESWYNPLTMG
jgi:hypothetical protein